MSGPTGTPGAGGVAGRLAGGASQSGCTPPGVQVPSELLQDGFQNHLGEHIVLPGQVPNDFKVIHVTEFFKRGFPPASAECLIELPGLSVEFRGVVLAQDHQHTARGIRGLCQGRSQVPLWAVPLSNLQGHEERGAVRGVQDRL